MEAAIALPIYIFAMLTLSYMIQSYYIENTIDAAAAGVMQDIAGKFFYLDQMGVFEAGDMIAERTKNKGGKLEAKIEKGGAEPGDGQAEENATDFTIGDAGQQLIDAWRDGGVLTILKALLPFKGELKDQFSGKFKQLSKGSKTLMDVFGSAKDAKGLGLGIASETVMFGLEYMLTYEILCDIRARMGEEAYKFRIRSFEIDMGDEGILYTDSKTGLDRLLTVNIKYKVGIPLFIAPEVELERTIRKTIRPWVGER